MTYGLQTHMPVTFKEIFRFLVTLEKLALVHPSEKRENILVRTSSSSSFFVGHNLFVMDLLRHKHLFTTVPSKSSKKSRSNAGCAFGYQSSTVVVNRRAMFLKQSH